MAAKATKVKGKAAPKKKSQSWVGGAPKRRRCIPKQTGIAKSKSVAALPKSKPRAGYTGKAVHLLVERRWTVAARRPYGISDMEGRQVLVRGVFEAAGRAREALSSARKGLSASERTGDFRRKTNLAVEKHVVDEPERSSGKPSRDGVGERRMNAHAANVGARSQTRARRPAWVVSGSIRESDLPTGTDEDEEEHFPINKFGCVPIILGVFSSPSGANAFATSDACFDRFNDASFECFGSLTEYSEDVIRYDSSGLAQVSPSHVGADGDVGGFIQVRKHLITIC
jgi:hypothetical protein